MVCLIYTRVSIQPWVGHKPVDQVIDNGSEVIYTSEPIVERRFYWGLHTLSFPPTFSGNDKSGFYRGALSQEVTHSLLIDLRDANALDCRPVAVEVALACPVLHLFAEISLGVWIKLGDDLP